MNEVKELFENPSSRYFGDQEGLMKYLKKRGERVMGKLLHSTIQAYP